MVDSPHYEHLKVFMEEARANRGLEAWDKDHENALKCLDDAVERLRAYRGGHGFTGVTGTAMERWVDASINRITKYKEGYERGYKTYLRGREVMATALAEAEKLSPDLLDAETAAMRDDLLVSVSDSKPGPGIRFMGKLYTTGSAYVQAVETQANEQREAAAQRIIKMFNDRAEIIGMILKDQTKKDPDDPGTDLDEYEKQEREKNPGGGGGTSGGGTSGGGTSGGGAGDRDWGYSRHDDFGRAADRDPSSPNYPGGFDQPWWSEADAAAARRRIVSSGAVETRELPYGELGSRTNPITDPQELMSRDLLHTRVNGTTYRNGVVGGHTPAPPADVDHPLWRLNGGAASDASTAGRLGGAGALGAGALGMRGAAQMGSGGAAGGLAGMRGITGTTNGLGAAGASTLKAGSYSGSGFGSYTPPAGANGGASGAGGAGGAAGRGSGGFMGAGAGAGAGSGKDDKKRRSRQYMAFRFEDDDDSLPAGYVNPMSQTYGTDKDIAPARRIDDGWDPRQW